MSKQISHIKNIFFIIVFLSSLSIGLLWLTFNYQLFGDNTGYLADYEVIKGPISIAESATQSSGMAFNPHRKLLYVIVNEPSEIHILSPEGKYIRKIDLQGFGDTEGITYIDNDTFAIVSERKGLISWFSIYPDTQSIIFDPEKSVKLFPHPIGNTGLEGISYSKDMGQLIIVKERAPQKIYTVQWPVADIKNPIVTIPWDAEAKSGLSVRGLSGIYYHSQTGHLFVLSRRSRRIIEYTPGGNEVGSFSLKTGSGNLQQSIGKAEGIVFSNDGTLYVCGEPNQLYIFKKIDNRKI